MIKDFLHEESFDTVVSARESTKSKIKILSSMLIRFFLLNIDGTF